MRLSIRHKSTSCDDSPAQYAARVLRMPPLVDAGLQIVRWHVTTNGPGRLSRFEDGFGNKTHVHTVVGVRDSLVVDVGAQVSHLGVQ